MEEFFGLGRSDQVPMNLPQAGLSDGGGRGEGARGGGEAGAADDGGRHGAEGVQGEQRAQQVEGDGEQGPQRRRTRGRRRR